VTLSSATTDSSSGKKPAMPGLNAVRSEMSPRLQIVSIAVIVVCS